MGYGLIVKPELVQKHTTSPASAVAIIYYITAGRKGESVSKRKVYIKSSSNYLYPLCDTFSVKYTSNSISIQNKILKLF